MFNYEQHGHAVNAFYRDPTNPYARSALGMNRHATQGMTRSVIREKVQDLSTRLGARFRLSNAGVPMFLIDVDGVRHSAVYFKRHDNWAVFFPYREKTQTRVTLDDEDEVAEFLSSKGELTTPEEGAK